MDLVLDLKELILIVLGVIIAYIKKKKKVLRGGIRFT